MSDFEGIFNRTISFLRGSGIGCKIEKHKVCTDDKITTLETAVDHPIPESIKGFYQNFSDGVWMFWETHDEECGGVELYSVEELIDGYQLWRRIINTFLEDPKSLDNCIRNQADREEAFEIWNELIYWVPFYDHGDGDYFCFHLKTGAIYYYSHSWFDGFKSIESWCGALASENLFEFLKSWSRFFFCPPQRLLLGINDSG